MSIRDKSLVSIGLLTYNRKKLLKNALRSLFNQSYKNIEILISDNASTDKTKLFCTKLVIRNKKVKYFRLKKHTDSYSNFRSVLSKAKGEYFMWAADDDQWHRNYIDHIVKELKRNPSAVLGVSAMKQFNLNVTKITYLDKFKKFEHSINAIKKFLLRPEYSASMLYGIFKTSIIKKTGIHKDIRPIVGHSSEIVTLISVLFHGDLVYINSPLFWKRDSGYYLTILTELRSFHLSSSIITHAKNYLLLPIANTFDLYYSIIVILKSTIQMSEKITLIFYCFIKFIRDIYLFIRDIIRGSFSICIGLFNKILPSF